jgi:O-antigen/teichoic acid export membrane protein
MVSLAQTVTDYLRPGSLRYRLTVGAFWSTVASGAGQAFTLASTVICGRVLGPGDYGRFALVVSTVTLFATVAALGLGVTATRYIAEYRRAEPERAGRVLGLSSISACGAGLLVAACLVAAAPWLSSTFLHAPQLANDLKIAAIFMFFSAFNTHQVGSLSGFEAFKPLTIAHLGRGIITLPLVTVGALIGGLHGAVIATALSSGLACILYAVVLKHQCRRHRVRIDYAIGREEWKLLYRFSIPVVIAGLSFTPAVWLTNALLARSSGYAELGVFNAAMQWQLIILFFATAVSNVGLPLLSHTLPERDMHKYKRVLAWIFVATTGSALVVATPVAVAAPTMMQLFGRGFQHSDVTVRLLCLSAVLSAMNIVVGHAIWSLDATVSGVLLALLRGATLVAFAFMFVRAGATGLATAYVSMAIVQTLASLVFMRWLLANRSMNWGKDRTARVNDFLPLALVGTERGTES